MKRALFAVLLVASVGLGLSSCACDPGYHEWWVADRELGPGPLFHQDPNMFQADCRTPNMVIVPAGK